MEQVDNQLIYQSNQNETDQQNDNNLDEFDYKDIISKKKEHYRVEIRKRKMNELLTKARKKPIISETVTLQKNFNSNEDRIYFVKQLLQQIQLLISQNIINDQIIDTIYESITNIIEAIVIENSSDKKLIEQALALGTIDIVLPIVEEECFKSYIYLLSNTYNLIGSLFYVDGQYLTQFVSDRLVNAVLGALVSNEPTIIEQGLFMSGNLISGNKKLKAKFYEQNFIEILFQIHTLDKLNIDNYGQLYYDAIQDYIWLISVFLEKNQGKFRKQIVSKDYKRLIEISFDLASNSKFYESQDLKTTRFLTANILDSVNTQDSLITYFFELQKIKNINLIERFLYIMNNCTQFDIIIVQNLSRFIFNIISGPEEFLDDLMSNKILDTFKLLYENYRDSVIFKGEIAWAVSNICTNSDKIQQVMDHPIYEMFMESFDQQYDDVKREILYVASQIFTGGNHNQMKRIVQSPFMGKYIRSMNTKDTRLIITLLQGINGLLHSFAQIFTADGENAILSSLEKHNLSGILQDLQNHQSEQVYKSVAQIIQNHFQYYE